MSLARRGILKGLGALLSAPVVGTAAVAATKQGTLPWAGLPAGAATQHPEMSPIHKALETFWAKRNRRRSRLNDWDIDLLAMKSWSPAYVLMIQKEREIQAHTALHKIYAALGEPLPPWLADLD
jgi:hypothetical protein